MNNQHLIKNSLLVLILLLIVVNSNSYACNQPNIKTENFWVALPPDVARSTAAYGVIKNIGSAPDTLVQISSDAGSVMLHKTEIRSGMARMVHVSNMVIEPGAELILEPMSYHLMFSNLTSAMFNEGGQIVVFLEFEKSGVIEVTVPIL